MLIYIVSYCTSYLSCKFAIENGMVCRKYLKKQYFFFYLFHDSITVPFSFELFKEVCEKEKANKYFEKIVKASEFQWDTVYTNQSFEIGQIGQIGYICHIRSAKLKAMVLNWSRTTFKITAVCLVFCVCK